MSLHTYLERIKYIDSLIRRKATGDLNTLAKKLSLSKSQTTYFLKEMRELGFPIKYSRKSGHYFYSEEGKLIQNLYEKDIPKNENTLPDEILKEISGGKSFFKSFLHADYIGMGWSNFEK